MLAVIVVIPAAYADASDELRRAGRDVSSLATAPLRWDSKTWKRFAKGVAVIGVVYAADRRLAGEAQQNRSHATDQFADFVTPFGGHRALEMSAVLWLSGAALRNPNLRDAGRDSLESELWAAGVVTPLLKRGFGRSRPNAERGARSFHPFDQESQSFPSGHATNAFAFATAVAAHYDGWVVPTIVYTMATGVAFSRVNDRAHFPADVVAGALIGRAVARGVVARHRPNGRTSRWVVEPFVDGRSAGVVVRLRHRATP